MSCSACPCLRVTGFTLTSVKKHCMNVSNRKLTLAHHHAISHDCSELLTSWIMQFDRGRADRASDGWRKGGNQEEDGQGTGSEEGKVEEEVGAEWRVWALGEVTVGHRCCKHPVRYSVSVSLSTSNNWTVEQQWFTDSLILWCSCVTQYVEIMFFVNIYITMHHV